ncbi:GTPase Era [Erysipelothrix rhusiopathiae]|uniref:GTPase Era n=2 Tax=Erysipelothrix TaxID=1647 RepID=E7FUB2_ERYRH|nr:GTPase Era [Erysipelothrix rhusiopathiae]CAH2762716.1 GTPase Era [Erysipelothrix sp. A18Y020d]EFY09715.1 ribosome biogenesis GTPase Era [Erysipelothrix rhusiopathiae ATCC 19414]MDE8256712.1 GTPase Era [Erysipelothrix rhusiopathiae]MDE8257793.1 GTPase Era [Erysipelothrix rhusiopathiae]MDE8339574.1 GTPase Era [Erysipelothrix rhusiopathiae]
MTFKSGFISIVGRPNAGKSTLINQIVKQKIAIVTEKAQTTRDAIIGVKTEEDYQLIFIDTPGIHKPKHQLGERMNRTAYAHFKGVDLVYYIIDGAEPFGTGDEFVIERLSKLKIPVFLIINKVDKMSEQALLERIAASTDFQFAEIVPISALENNNVDRLLDVTLSYMEEGVMYYPKDQVSAYPEQFIMAEIVREKILELTEEEIPHSVAVAIERIVKKKNATIISAVILVDRPSQKGIIIGKQGSMIKQIGERARGELETVLGEKVFLETYVRVEKNWRNRARMLNQLGYIETEYEQ